MILAIDIDYREPQAQAAALLFEKWESKEPFTSYRLIIENIAPYESGSFYKRELPCITALLEIIKEEIKIIIVDGYVWLDENNRPGLGAYLFHHLKEKIPVIGVAKNKFKAPNPFMTEIYRGKSKKPLYITAAGIELKEAANFIKNMHGEFRIPDLLKKVDMLCRDWGQPNGDNKYNSAN